MKTVLYFTLLFTAIVKTHNSFSQTVAEWNDIEQQQAHSAANNLHLKACSISPYISQDPWHISNLYNCFNKELFIPYHLWTGAKWNGDKSAPCMHTANSRSMLNSPDERHSKGEVIITGPLQWKDDMTGETIGVWQRQRSTSNSKKYYVCHQRGIGGIHNVNKPWVKWVRGLCHIPAGFGWKVGQKRTCVKTTVEIIDIQLDPQDRLQHITVKYWFRDKLHYRYTYERDHGTKKIFNYQQ